MPDISKYSFIAQSDSLLMDLAIHMFYICQK